MSEPTRRDELVGHGTMLLFSALVAGSFSLGARVANDIDPMALTSLRFILAALLVGALGWFTGQIKRESFAAPWRYVLLGGLFGAYFVFMFEGLKTAPPVSTAAVFTLTPIMAAGFGWLVLRQVTTAHMAFALAIGGIGALWVIFRADFSAFLRFEVGQGEIIYFWGAAAHALYIPLARRLNKGEAVFAYTFGILVAGALLVGLAGAPAIGATEWGALPARVWGVLAYLTVFASVMSISLLQIGTMRLKAAKVMAYTYLTPSFVILWEIALGQAAPRALILVGVGLTIVALIILLREDPYRSPDS